MKSLLMLVRLFFALVKATFIAVKYQLSWLIPRHYRYKDISGQVVLVTGGGSGIGRLICLRLAKLDCKVISWDINSEGNAETVKMIREDGGQAFAYTVNVGNRDDVYKTAAKVKDDIGKVDILFNNAGIVAGNDILDLPDHLIERTFKVNIMAHFWTVKAFLPDMLIAKRGHIVNVASAAGLTGLNKLSDYCASKFAAVGFHESLTMEFRVAGQDYIKSTVVCPFFISTGMFDGACSPYIPFLEPDYVADEIVDAVRLDVEYLVLPWSLKPLLFLRQLMPPHAGAVITTDLGGDTSMDNFVGRKKDN